MRMPTASRTTRLSGRSLSPKFENDSMATTLEEGAERGFFVMNEKGSPAHTTMKPDQPVNPFEKQVVEKVEQVAWEVIPQMAEAIINKVAEFAVEQIKLLPGSLEA